MAKLARLGKAPSPIYRGLIIGMWEVPMMFGNFDQADMSQALVAFAAIIGVAGSMFEDPYVSTP